MFGSRTSYPACLQVASTSKIKVGQWLRIFVTAPNNRNGRRRGLLASEQVDRQQNSRRGLRQASAPAPSGDEVPLVARLFDDPALQAALSASFVAEAQQAEALAANPDKVPAQWFEPNATNPLGMDPWLLAVGHFAANALLADPEDDSGSSGGERAPGLALDGTLDAYLYGENIADSGRNGGERGIHARLGWSLIACALLQPVQSTIPGLPQLTASNTQPCWHAGVYPNDDHIRFVSR